MKEMDFNVMDNLAKSDFLNEMGDKALEAIKSMQVEAPQVEIPSHIVPPIIKKHEESQTK